MVEFPSRHRLDYCIAVLHDFNLRCGALLCVAVDIMIKYIKLKRTSISVTQLHYIEVIMELFREF